MKIKKEPKKPARIKNKQYEKEIFEGESLKSIVDFLAEQGIDLASVTIDKKREYWDDYYIVYLYWKADESDEEFSKRTKAYNTKLANYKKWCSENESEIKAEIEKREEEEEKKHQREIVRLETKLKKLKEGE